MASRVIALALRNRATISNNDLTRLASEIFLTSLLAESFSNLLNLRLRSIGLICFLAFSIATPPPAQSDG
jgi:hypothetical protein